jgi:hypothetical protein
MSSLLWGPHVVAVEATDEAVEFRPRTCGTPEPPAAEIMMATREASRFLPESARFRVERVKFRIPIAFHIVHDNGSGDVSERQIDAQIGVLNSKLGPLGFEFTKHSISRTNNPVWHRMVDGEQSEIEAKRTLSVDPTRVLNFYLAKPRFWQHHTDRPPELRNALGLATFPWWLDREEVARVRDGVIVDYETLPGSAPSQFDMGYTAVHEVGHWIGLLHTFHGGGANARESLSGCMAPGDEVGDTPYEHQANEGPGLDAECPRVIPSLCPTGGLNPIHNYMNYSDDRCMTEWTPGQQYRAANMMQQYRRGFVDASPSVLRMRSLRAL